MEIILDLIIVFLSTLIGYKFGSHLKNELRMEVKSYQRTIESLAFELKKARNEVESLKQFLKKES